MDRDRANRGDVEIDLARDRLETVSDTSVVKRSRCDLEEIREWLDDTSAEVIPADVRAEYLRANAAAVPSIVADYRASAGIDVEHDQADRDAGNQLRMPVTVVQQDWGSALGYDAAGVWRARAPHLVHLTTAAGHLLAEEVPGEIATVVRELVAR